MAMSIDGFIATKENETPWSDEEWQSYKKIVTECKNVIIGRRTYQLMKNGNEFEKIGNPLTIVVTSDKSLKDDSKCIFVDSPRKALHVLLEKGFKKALVGGGQKLNSAFLQEGLLDEIYLDIEPFVFGSGVSLFNDDTVMNKLILLDTHRYNKNAIQLHYRIDR